MENSVLKVKRTIAGKLLKILFSLYFMVTVVLTASHMLTEFYHTQNIIVAELETFEELLRPVITRAIIEKDYSYIEDMLSTTVSSSAVVGATVQIQGQTEEWHSGYFLDDDMNWKWMNPRTHHVQEAEDAYGFTENTFEISKTDAQGNTVKLGQAYLYTNHKAVLSHVWFGYQMIIFTAIIKTLALCGIFLWVAHLYLRRPLLNLTYAAQSVQKGDLEHAHVSEVVSPQNELDILSHTFNRMVDELGVTRRRLQQTQDRLGDIINAMPTVIICVTQEGVVVDWNRNAVIHTQVAAEDAIGKFIGEVYKPYAEHMSKVRQALREQKVQMASNTVSGSVEDTHFYDVLVYPLISGTFRGAVIRLDDVTNRVHMESIMVQSEKMSSIGSLAAGMAHEINNPLGAILQGVQNIERRIDPNLVANQESAASCGIDLKILQNYFEERKITKFLHGIRESGERAANIVANLLQFSRRTNTNRTRCSLVSAVNKAIELARADYNLEKQTDFRKVKVEVVAEEGLPDVFVCGMEVEQVILNLLKNASHAMKGVDRDPRIEIRLESTSDMVQMQVSDNGAGMTDAVRKRIFEPFFTTKPVGEGTGLGLSVSYGIIVEAHKGEMQVESIPGIGTVFTIRLPAYKEGMV